MKLELKHIAPYLPYELQMAYIVRDKIVEIGSLDKVFIYIYETYPIRYGINNNDVEHEWMFKPFLRSLSSMTEKELEELNRIKNNDSIYIAITTDNYVYFECSNNDPYEGTPKLNLSTMNDIYEWLFKHHFDMFNLIENNLAINKTEIK